MNLPGFFYLRDYVNVKPPPCPESGDPWGAEEVVDRALGDATASLIFVRALDPNEGLCVDHVPGLEVAEVGAHAPCKGEERRISGPSRP